ncbi:MAG: arylesterase [Pseudomonadota bacterium]|nr:arylesterase [Pseudomonadota bacterium]
MLSAFAYGARRAFVHAAVLMLAGAAAPAVAQDVHILAFGDSLTAGYGLPKGQGFAPQLEDALRRNGVRAFVTDAGVSGDTTAAGRARLGWTLDGLARKPDLAIVALGGNDMLRALPPARTRAEMDAILAEFRRRGIKLVVAGMLAAPNLGAQYGGAFNRIFPELARKYDAALYPFFLNGVAGDRRLVLPDGVHPNFQGIKRMVSAILPTIDSAAR